MGQYTYHSMSQYSLDFKKEATRLIKDMVIKGQKFISKNELQQMVQILSKRLQRCKARSLGQGHKRSRFNLMK